MSNQKPIDEFYRFMVGRETIRLRRAIGSPWPWTTDPILQTYKFTNVRREYDWTSHQLMKRFYNPNRQATLRQILYNCAVARYFGTVEFALAAGWSPTHRPQYLKTLAKARMKEKRPVFTGAYVITNQGIKGPKVDVVVDIFLEGLWNWMHDASVPFGEMIMDQQSWRALITAMRAVPGFGGTGFMAKEVVLDTLFTQFWPKREPLDFNTWCPLGPGGRRGLARVYEGDPEAKVSATVAQQRLKDLWAYQDTLWPKEYGNLCLHDIQFQLCEFDKYQRVLLGEGRPRSKYRPRKRKGEYFPPGVVLT